MPISVASPRRLARLSAPLTAIVRGTLALEACAVDEVAIVLTDDGAIRDLNRRYRGIDRATDVLSFDYAEPQARPRREPPPAPAPRSRTVTGDLVISLDRVRVQAKRYRVSEGKELARLLVHGALHLAGLDHQTARDRAEMRTRERRALRSAAARISALCRLLTRLPGAGTL